MVCRNVECRTSPQSNECRNINDNSIGAGVGKEMNLNERIHKVKGNCVHGKWKHKRGPMSRHIFTCGICGLPETWPSDNEAKFQAFMLDEIPDYLSDHKAMMEMLFDLAVTGQISMIGIDAIKHDMRWKDQPKTIKTMLRAIGEAWCEWKEAND